MYKEKVIVRNKLSLWAIEMISKELMYAYLLLTKLTTNLFNNISVTNKGKILLFTFALKNTDQALPSCIAFVGVGIIEEEG